MSSMVVAFDRAIVAALCELMGKAAGAFILRVRDELIREGYSEDEANMLINSFLSSAPDSCIDVSSHTGCEVSPNGIRAVRKAFIDVIEDLMVDDRLKARFLSRIGKEIKKSFSGDLDEAVKQLNEAIEGSPIEHYETRDSELELKLKREADLLAYTIASIRDDNPVLISKEGGHYVFKRR